MKKIVRIVFCISFVFYLFGLLIVLFLGSRGSLWSDLTMLEYIRYSSNIVPFKTINTYFKAMVDGSMNMDIPVKNLVGNFILFLPMGIYLPIFFRKINKAGIFFLSMMTMLFIVEVIQLVTRRGSFDIDDFILNILGALIGFGIMKTKTFQKLCIGNPQLKAFER
ncbi:VanZ family protein [Siminovitchia fortis]|uniref:VanZ family protein n=1 Tax=Siminovitchia fortis TaxID=254758 RepID=A0A443IKQ5_9BACI|nr:VanZ family protein [Siminovitchia fortis]RWR05282.1 VanZ family protein [Siminovitchia fortis]WHY82428.1 VanZ family protein [Siminovitchia fortis]